MELVNETKKNELIQLLQLKKENSAEKIKGDGLSNMQKRTAELKGIFEISSTPGKGTTVSALLPITIISDTV